MNQFEMLNLINRMQPTAQNNLPVIPNNGNPAGAYNMPTTATSLPPIPTTVAPINPTTSTPTPPRLLGRQGLGLGGHGGGTSGYYPWMNQSSHMDWIQQWLDQREPFQVRSMGV